MNGFSSDAACDKFDWRETTRAKSGDGADADEAGGFDFIVGNGERERGRRLFKQKEIQKGREGAQRGNDFLSLSLYQLLRRGKM